MEKKMFLQAKYLIRSDAAIIPDGRKNARSYSVFISMHEKRNRMD
jgi:dihydropteroate synthase